MRSLVWEPAPVVEHPSGPRNASAPPAPAALRICRRVKIAACFIRSPPEWDKSNRRVYPTGLLLFILVDEFNLLRLARSHFNRHRRGLRREARRFVLHRELVLPRREALDRERSVLFRHSVERMIEDMDVGEHPRVEDAFQV